MNIQQSERLILARIQHTARYGAIGGDYSKGTRVEDSERHGPFLLMQMTALVCLYIGAVSVIDGFFGLYSYLAFSFGMTDPSDNAAWQQAFTEFQNNPVRTLGFTLYNICIWNAVIIFSIWMMRRRLWALHTLQRLLGIDMVVTVLNLCWPMLYAAATMAEIEVRQVSSPGLFIFVNAMQVGAIIVLAHPRVQAAVEQSATNSQSNENE